MAALVPSPPMIARCSRSSGTRKPSDRSSASVGASSPRSAPRQRGEVGAMDAAPVDLAGRRHDHADARRARQHRVVQLLALHQRARLRVVELRERGAHAALQARGSRRAPRPRRAVPRARLAPPRRCRRRSARRARGRSRSRRWPGRRSLRAGRCRTATAMSASVARLPAPGSARDRRHAGHAARMDAALRRSGCAAAARRVRTRARAAGCAAPGPRCGSRPSRRGCRRARSSGPVGTVIGPNVCVVPSRTAR